MSEVSSSKKVGSLAQNCLPLKSLLTSLDFGSDLLLLYSSPLALDLVPIGKFLEEFSPLTVWFVFILSHLLSLIVDLCKSDH